MRALCLDLLGKDYSSLKHLSNMVAVGIENTKVNVINPPLRHKVMYLNRSVSFCHMPFDKYNTLTLNIHLNNASKTRNIYYTLACLFNNNL